MVSLVLHALRVHNVTTVDVIMGDAGAINAVERWMYRATHDSQVDEVAAGGFTFPSRDYPSVIGTGGLFFACDVEHVLAYAAEKGQARPHHFFMCPMPDPAVILESPMDSERGIIKRDTYVRGVRSGSHVGDEFVKARSGRSDVFIPEVLIWVLVQ